MTRRALFSIAAAAGVGAGSYPFYIEPRSLELTETRVALQRFKRTTPLRLAHLTDLHASSSFDLSLVDRAISLALGARPDIACITGDFVTWNDDSRASGYPQVLRRLSQAIPTFAVFGNHDGGTWAHSRGGSADTREVQRLVENSGIELLHNRSRQIEIHGERVSIVGVGDLWAEQLEARRAFTAVDQRNATILLSHNPDSKQVLEQEWWDLMLSGHTHGGQVRIPFQGDRFAPVVDKRYVAGLRAWNDRQIFVSRGVGNLMGIRFRCRPEVSILSVV
jgi:predicted MPP superfamily phosphohydrolase